MAVTILEALMNAEINIDNGKRMPQILDLAKEQLHNAVTLLSKGYSVNDEVEPLLEAHGNADSVPEKPIQQEAA